MKIKTIFLMLLIATSVSFLKLFSSESSDQHRSVQSVAVEANYCDKWSSQFAVEADVYSFKMNLANVIYNTAHSQSVYSIKNKNVNNAVAMANAKKLAEKITLVCEAFGIDPRVFSMKILKETMFYAQDAKMSNGDVSSGLCQVSSELKNKISNLNAVSGSFLNVAKTKASSLCQSNRVCSNSDADEELQDLILGASVYKLKESDVLSSSKMIAFRLPKYNGIGLPEGDKKRTLFGRFKIIDKHECFDPQIEGLTLGIYNANQELLSSSQNSEQKFSRASHYAKDILCLANVAFNKKFNENEVFSEGPDLNAVRANGTPEASKCLDYASSMRAPKSFSDRIIKVDSTN